jgi:hypothetical protein
LLQGHVCLAFHLYHRRHAVKMTQILFELCVVLNILGGEDIV